MQQNGSFIKLLWLAIILSYDLLVYKRMNNKRHKYDSMFQLAGGYIICKCLWIKGCAKAPRLVWEKWNAALATCSNIRCLTGSPVAGWKLFYFPSRLSNFSVSVATGKTTGHKWWQYEPQKWHRLWLFDRFLFDEQISFRDWEAIEFDVKLSVPSNGARDTTIIGADSPLDELMMGL